MHGCNRNSFGAVFGVLDRWGDRMSLYEAFDSGGEKGRTVAEFEKMRFELAWRHFDLHAKQRTQMFHFFIILTPFLFGGCFILFKEREIMGFMATDHRLCRRRLPRAAVPSSRPEKQATLPREPGRAPSS